MQEDLIDYGYSISTDITPEIYYEGKLISIKRAISNILSNACKYGQKDIHISLIQNENSIICEISDKGQGISQENIAQIMLPFYREDKSRNISGSGLGLTIAKEIIEAHGGKIKILMNQPTGLIVRIVL
jgi:signal transduction histidine kinase